MRPMAFSNISRSFLYDSVRSASASENQRTSSTSSSWSSVFPPRYSIRKDRKSTRLNSSHLVISYAVFCLKKKNTYYLVFALLLSVLLGPLRTSRHPRCWVTLYRYLHQLGGPVDLTLFSGFSQMSITHHLL